MRGRMLVKPPGAELSDHPGQVAKEDKAQSAAQKGTPSYE
jgi:hypothetical protein